MRAHTAKRKQSRPVRPARATKVAKRAVSGPGRAIVLRAPNLPANPYELTIDHVTLIKNTIAKGASDDELKLFLAIARRHRLDPFTQQIWLVPRWDSKADSGKRLPNGEAVLGAYVRTTQIGINGMLYIAARDHKDFGSVSLPQYGPIVDFKSDDGITVKAPEWVRVTVHKKGVEHPSEAEAWWSEYAPSKMGTAPFWKKMPRRMLAKCATALAIRQAYPDLSGIFIPEECEKMAEETAPSGRQIVVQQPKVNTHEQKYLEREAEALQNLDPAQREVVERKMAEVKAKMEQKSVPQTPAEPVTLFAMQLGEDQYEIVGAEKLDTSGKKLLLPFWKEESHALVLTAEQLDGVRFEFEKRGISIRPLKRP